MASRLNPYLSFKNTARAAMDFYKSVFGGELTISTFAELGGSKDPADKDLIMHSQLVAPNGYWLMASDTPAHMEHKPGNNISISLSGDDDAALNAQWTALSQGATITQPLTSARWGYFLVLLV
jgi:PhnB protein